MAHQYEPEYGDRFKFIEGSLRHEVVFTKRKADKLEFRDEVSVKAIRISVKKFNRMCEQETAVRLPGKSPLELVEIEACLDIQEEFLSKTALKRLRAKHDAYKKCLTFQFVLIELDKEGCGVSVPNIARLMKKIRNKALARGLDKFPHPSRVVEAARAYGRPGDRNLCYFLTKFGKHKKSKFGPFIDGLKDKVISDFWREKSPYANITAATGVLLGTIAEENQARVARGEPKFEETPCREIIRIWIKEAETKAGFAARNGAHGAHRRYDGCNTQDEVTSPLERVMIDHSFVPIWLKILDARGTVIDVLRPWMATAYDVHSKSVLGAILSFENPSIYTVMALMKQVMLPKDFLQQYGIDQKWAQEIYGKPFEFVLDNAVENIGLSLQVFLGVIGVDANYAPVYTPEFKPGEERLHSVFNKGLWHLAPGGFHESVEELRESGRDPRQEVLWTLDEAIARMWEFITMRHMDEHRTTRAPPVRLFLENVDPDRQRPSESDRQVLNHLFGKAARVVLTREGVEYRGHRFHDPVVTSELLRTYLPNRKRTFNERLPTKPGWFIWSLSNTRKTADCSVSSTLNVGPIHIFPTLNPSMPPECRGQLPT
jgi:putative transposase